MAKKDIQEKLLEDFPDVFADIVNVAGFFGEQIIEPDSLEDGPTASIYKAAEGNNREQFRDVCKYSTKLGVHMMLLGLENQTDVDHDMVFRVMRYDGASYKMQDKKHKKAPVITWVLYFGCKRWKAPKSIHEAIIKGFPNWKKVMRFVPDYQINLIEVAFLPKQIREQFTSDFRIVAEYLHAKRTGHVEEFYGSPEGHQKIQHVQAILEFLQTFGKDERYKAMESRVYKEAEIGGNITMCTLLDYAENKGIKRINQLNKRLAEENRYEDIIRAAKDEQYQKKLFEELKI